MRLVPFLSIIFMTLGLWSQGQAVEFEQGLIDEFGQIQANCFASLPYDLTDPIETVAESYHTQMQCLFSTATHDFMTETESFFQPKLDDLQSDYELKQVPNAPADCAQDFTSIKAAQAEFGYQSFCDTRGPQAEKEYSLCRVTETAFNEFCAYQEYVYFKSRNEVLLRQCDEVDQLTNRASCVEREQAKLQKELSMSSQTLEGSLEKYENFMQSWTMHHWLTVLTETLENTFRRLHLAREALQKWPLKFHDAASQKRPKAIQ